VLLGVLPVRVTIAAAGLGGLAATAAFARPVLRARPRERDLDEPGQGEPGQGEPGQGEPGQGEPGQGEPGQGEPGRHDAKEQAGAGRRAGAAEPARPLR
jgi:hypothetical protein